MKLIKVSNYEYEVYINIENINRIEMSENLRIRLIFNNFFTDITLNNNSEVDKLIKAIIKLKDEEIESVNKIIKVINKDSGNVEYLDVNDLNIIKDNKDTKLNKNKSEWCLSNENLRLEFDLDSLEVFNKETIEIRSLRHIRA